ncbi:MAG: 7-carboxy-7-deazaguanine synthase QueE [Verrucomicrobia bacterium]|nr:7-carboxy-7-deazaguanine synthase QueE [Verrucomicrobiota bacterium]
MSSIFNISKEIPLMEEFPTLQGEGFHSGRFSYFVRVAGCDVGCHWCDVKESWKANKHPLVSYDNIFSNALRSGAKFIVVTGGEPFMYSLESLCKKFLEKNFELAVETSGAYPITGTWHWICLSPKKNKAPLDEFYAKANELKVIIYNKDDFKWAEEHASKVNSECKLYLQVEWSKRDENTPLILDYIKENPQWKLSLQTHKYIGIP